MSFSKRLENFLNLHELSASTLAEKIDINRSTISHLLSGRNKPSLDLIMKLHEHFPNIDLEWWIYGQGNLKDLNQEKDNKPQKSRPLLKDQSENSDLDIEAIKNFNPAPPSEFDKSKKIKRVLILYEDGSFDDYRN